MTVKKVFFQNSKGDKLAGILHLPDKEGKFPAVIRMHGYRSSKDGSSSKAFCESLEQDFVCLRFDFWAHNESEGDFVDLTVTEELDDARAAIEFISNLEQVDKERVGIEGSSLGGMIAIHTAANNPKVKAAVFVCPVSNFKKTFSRMEDIELWKKQGWKLTYNSAGKEFKIGYQFFEDGCKYDLYKEAEKINFPTLIIHGDADKSVSIEDSKELVKHLKNTRLEIVNDSDHQFSKPEHSKIRVEKTAEFFRLNL